MSRHQLEKQHQKKAKAEIEKAENGKQK